MVHRRERLKVPGWVAPTATTSVNPREHSTEPVMAALSLSGTARDLVTELWKVDRMVHAKVGSMAPSRAHHLARGTANRTGPAMEHRMEEFGPDTGRPKPWRTREPIDPSSLRSDEVDGCGKQVTANNTQLQSTL